MRRPWTIIVALCLLTVLLVLFYSLTLDAGNVIPVAARDALAEASEYTLISLEPTNTMAGAKGLYGWLILGETVVKNPGDRTTILSIVEDSVAEHGELGAQCFDPRHAVRVIHEGHKYEVLICFECSWINVFVDGRMVKAVVLRGDAHELQPQLDHILTDAGLPLAKSTTW